MGIRIKNLDKWENNKFGYYQDMIHPKGECFNSTYFSFYRDLFTMPGTASGTNFSLSVCTVKNRPLMIDTVEYHSNAYELLIPLDGDILIHVIPASPNDALPLEKIEVFMIPKGTAVVLKCGVWHHAPFAYNTETVNVLVGLPERTYANDCNMKTLDTPIPIVE